MTGTTPAIIARYRAWRRETISRRGVPVTPASINQELACLKRMFDVAAYRTGMRNEVILNLTWDRPDFEDSVTGLRPEDTKTQEG
jgi:hypothetical protein